MQSNQRVPVMMIHLLLSSSSLPSWWSRTCMQLLVRAMLPGVNSCMWPSWRTHVNAAKGNLVSATCHQLSYLRLFMLLLPCWNDAAALGSTVHVLYRTQHVQQLAVEHAGRAIKGLLCMQGDAAAGAGAGPLRP